MTLFTEQRFKCDSACRESPYGILANVGYMEYGVTDVE